MMKIKIKDLKLIIESYLFEQDEEAEADAEEEADAEPEADAAPAPAADADAPAEDKTQEQVDAMIKTTEAERDIEKAFENFLATFKALSIANPELEAPIPRNLDRIFPKNEFPEGKIKVSDVEKAGLDGSARTGINNTYV